MSAPTLLRLIRSQQGVLFCLGERATWADRKRLRDLEAEAAWLRIAVPDFVPPMPPVMVARWGSEVAA